MSGRRVRADGVFVGQVWTSKTLAGARRVTIRNVYRKDGSVLVKVNDGPSVVLAIRDLKAKYYCDTIYL